MGFDAFRLADVLKAGGVNLDNAADEIVFTAQDGYAPNTSFDELKKHEAYLAFAEHGKPVSSFGKVEQGKAMVSPAPFYVVWKEGAKIEHEVPWPYQLVKIEVVRFETKYPKMFPKGAADSSPAKKGFLVFKAQCVRCHSINLEGGDLGPELNAPKNVTEYWSPDTLKAYIRDASSFRYRDKMPSFTELSEREIDDLLAYLAYMKDFKAKP
jgi:mono/diheme cytochrome c family protein